MSRRLITVFSRAWKLPEEGDFVIIGEGIRRRQLNGDLVIDANTKQIDIETSHLWLFDSEKQDPSCYAREMIELQRKANARRARANLVGTKALDVARALSYT